MRWFENDVSGLPIGNIFKGEAVEEARPLKVEKQVVPKRRFQTFLRRVVTKNAEKFKSVKVIRCEDITYTYSQKIFIRSQNQRLIKSGHKQP